MESQIINPSESPEMGFVNPQCTSLSNVWSPPPGWAVHLPPRLVKSFLGHNPKPEVVAFAESPPYNGQASAQELLFGASPPDPPPRRCPSSPRPPPGPPPRRFKTKYTFGSTPLSGNWTWMEGSPSRRPPSPRSPPLRRSLSPCRRPPSPRSPSPSSTAPPRRRSRSPSCESSRLFPKMEQYFDGGKKRTRKRKSRKKSKRKYIRKSKKKSKRKSKKKSKRKK